MFRGLAAILLVLLGCWCLLWFAIFAAIALITREAMSLGAYLPLVGWFLVSFGAAYIIQPWLAHPWRRADEA